jgi:hypothetical protein
MTFSDVTKIELASERSGISLIRAPVEAPTSKSADSAASRNVTTGWPRREAPAGWVSWSRKRTLSDREAQHTMRWLPRKAFSNPPGKGEAGGHT